MRPKTIAALLAATALVAAYGSPAGATAARPSRILKQRASVSAQLQLRGSRGFRVSLSASETSTNLVASKHTTAGGFQSAFYGSFDRHPRPSFEADRLNVRIGRLGRFRARFVPTRTETQEAFPTCKGNPSTVEYGFFVSSLDFRGERGYTVARSHRVRGTVTRQPAGTCTLTGEWPWHESKREIKEQKARERNELHLIAADQRARVLFEVRRQEATGGELPEPTFDASVNGRRVGRFRVSYMATDFGFEAQPETNLQVPNLAEPLAEATVAPPAPFSGTATFHLDSPNTASWTGDLAVEMPGLGKVPLTGEGIDAGLCKGTACTKTLPKDLQPLLEAPGDAILITGVSKPKRDR